MKLILWKSGDVAKGNLMQLPRELHADNFPERELGGHGSTRPFPDPKSINMKRSISMSSFSINVLTWGTELGA